VADQPGNRRRALLRQVPVQPTDKKDEKKDGPISTTGTNTNFSDFKIDASA
jgi:hypothetical protein